MASKSFLKLDQGLCRKVKMKQNILFSYFMKSLKPGHFDSSVLNQVYIS